MRLLQRAHDRRRRGHHPLTRLALFVFVLATSFLTEGVARADELGAVSPRDTAGEDRGWTGRHMPNVGLLVTRTGGQDGAPQTTGLGFEATYTLFFASMVSPAPSPTGRPFDVGWRSVVRRLTAVAVGAFAQVEFADFASTRDTQTRIALGGHFGTFFGVEAGMYYRAGANGFAGTLGLQLAPYLSLGAISFAVRLPIWSTRAGDAGLPRFEEDVALAVKIAPLHLLAIIFGWESAINPDYR